MMGKSNFEISRRGLILNAAALSVTPMLLGCARRLPTYRYRLTVEVETPWGVKSGSSVIEVRTRHAPGFPGPEAGGIRSELKGEAVVVDLAPGKTLFALLRSNGYVDWAKGALLSATPLPPEIDKQDYSVRLKAAIKDQRKHVMPHWKRINRNDVISTYPMLVTFRDLSDPTSVKLVDADDLSKTFGEGFRLSRVSVEVTDHRVTRKISKKLPWLTESFTTYLDGKKFGGGPSLPNILTAGDFRRI